MRHSFFAIALFFMFINLLQASDKIEIPKDEIILFESRPSLLDYNDWSNDDLKKQLAVKKKVVSAMAETKGKSDVIEYEYLDTRQTWYQWVGLTTRNISRIGGVAAVSAGFIMNGYDVPKYAYLILTIVYGVDKFLTEVSSYYLDQSASYDKQLERLENKANKDAARIEEILKKRGVGIQTTNVNPGQESEANNSNQMNHIIVEISQNDSQEESPSKKNEKEAKEMTGPLNMTNVSPITNTRDEKQKEVVEI